MENDPRELITIRSFGDMTEALMAQGCLRSAGIDSYLADVNMTRIDWPVTRGMKLQVGVDDVEAAIALLEESAEDDSEAPAAEI